MARQQSGFTLLELLVSIAVIAILVVIGMAFANSFRQQAEMDETLAEMKALTFLAEEARLLPGGDAFTRRPSHVIANFIQANGGNAKNYSTTVGERSPTGTLYLLTTTNRLGMVEVDVPQSGLAPYGVDARNVGGASRLTAGYKPVKLRHFSAQARWDKKVFYCEGYTPTTLPPQCR